MKVDTRSLDYIELNLTPPIVVWIGDISTELAKQTSAKEAEPLLREALIGLELRFCRMVGSQL